MQPAEYTTEYVPESYIDAPEGWVAYEHNRLLSYLELKQISLSDIAAVRSELEGVVAMESQFELQLDPDTTKEIETIGGMQNYREHILMQYFELIYGHNGSQSIH